MDVRTGYFVGDNVARKWRKRGKDLTYRPMYECQ